MLSITTFLLAAGVTFGAAGTSLDADGLVREGQAALQAGRYDDAVQLLRQALETDPADVRARLLLGESFLAQGRGVSVETEEDWERALDFLRQAEAACRHAIDVDSTSCQAWAQLGQTLLRMGNAEESIASLYHAQSLGGPNLELTVDLADALMMSRQFALEDGNPEQAQARLAEAEAVVRSAASTLDVQADLQRALGDVLAARGENQEAMQAYRRAITIRPSDTGLHDALLATMERGKQFEQSIAFYTGLVDEPALAQWYGGRSHELKGHVAYNVERDYEKAVEEYRLAEELLYQSAVTNSEYRASADQYIPLLRSYEGYALTKAGKLDQAEAAFLAALDRRPGLENARAGLKALLDEYWVIQGGEEATQEDFDQIRAFAARLCVVLPRDANVWNNYGFFAREAGCYDESYQAYRRSMALAPDNARIINDTALILVYHLRRDLDIAEDWLREARDLAEEELDRAKEANDMAAIEVATETYGDTFVNLITLYWQIEDTERAGETLMWLREVLPDRREIPMWHKRLFPGEPLEPEGDVAPPDLPAGHPDPAGSVAEDG